MACIASEVFGTPRVSETPSKTLSKVLGRVRAIRFRVSVGLSVSMRAHSLVAISNRSVPQGEEDLPEISLPPVLPYGGTGQGGSAGERKYYSRLHPPCLLGQQTQHWRGWFVPLENLNLDFLFLGTEPVSTD